MIMETGPDLTESSHYDSGKVGILMGDVVLVHWTTENRPNSTGFGLVWIDD